MKRKSKEARYYRLLTFPNTFSGVLGVQCLYVRGFKEEHVAERRRNGQDSRRNKDNKQLQRDSRQSIQSLFVTVTGKIKILELFVIRVKTG
jgi:hypothetical protein